MLFTALATEDAKRVGCDKAHVDLEVTTLLGKIAWTAHMRGWKDTHIIVSGNPATGSTPGRALAGSLTAFNVAIDAEADAQEGGAG